MSSREAAAGTSRRRRRLPAPTVRGGALAVVGVAACTAGVLLDLRDLVRVGALLLVVLLAAVVLAATARPRLAVQRTVTPSLVPAGSTAVVRVDVESTGGRGGGTLLAQDEVPATLAARPRFVLGAFPVGARASVRYTVRAGARGLHEIGPLRLDVLDPLGLVRVPRDGSARDHLVVTPHVEDLPARAGGGRRAAPRGRVVTSAAGSEDDVVPREYRTGDDRRRVHWPSTARRGQLMVRRDERPERPSATVLLDRRAVGSSDSSGGGFERRVRAAASVAVRAGRDGHAVRLVLGEPGADDVRVPGRRPGPLLHRLALVRPAGAAAPVEPSEEARRARGAVADAVLLHAVGAVAAAPSEPLVVAVLAADEVRPGGAVEALCRVRGDRRCALVVHDGDGAGLAHARTTAQLLARSGWGTALLGPQDRLGEAWASAWSAPGRGTGPLGAAS